MPLFSRLKNKGAQATSKSKTQPDFANGKPVAPAKPRFQSSWSSRTIEPAEVEELVHACTAELKSRGEALNAPFLLLPFRPDTDASGARTFIRNFYKSNGEGSHGYRGAGLAQELRLTEPAVLCSIMKWCWSRIPDGVVTWPVYEGFQSGERESNMARNAFHTFIPIGAGTEARRNIIFDFFDLLAAVAAHGKMNGLGGRKLSRLAGWWAFEHSDDGKGFEGGYRSWAAAADASSHLFFAYLRSQSPDADPSMNVIERIPRSLQALLASTEYPPETPTLLQRSTPRVVMLVDAVSPTPFALLRRAKHFEYRHNDRVLREYSEFEDPLDALTDECKRVLYAISSINSAAAVSRHGNMAKTGQESWSAFQNMGFSDLDQTMLANKPTIGMNGNARPTGQPLRAQPRSRNANDHGRPTTPSWADFLSSGFSEDDLTRAQAAFSMPSDKMLPPLGSRTQTPSHTANGGDDHLAPGEMAAIVNVELDDAFWWVWMTSLSGEEPADRKAVFGRCALVETTVMNGRWLIMEEQVKGASPDPAEGAYIAPKKSSIFSFTKRGRAKKQNSYNASSAPSEPLERVTSATPSKGSLAPEQASRIKSAAAELARRHTDKDAEANQRRGRHDDSADAKTSSMLTMGMMSEASPAMRWANAYDKNATRKQYLGDSFAGKGTSHDGLSKRTSSIMLFNDGASSIMPAAPALSPGTSMFPSDNIQNRELPALPKEERTVAGPETSHPTKLSADDITPAKEYQPAATMPPKAPEVHMLPADAEEVQQEAQQVPLPETTFAERSNPLEKELGVNVPPAPKVRLGRKPVPRSSKLPEHPAFRQKPVEEPTAASMVAPEPLPQTPQSPQSTTEHARLAAQRALEGNALSSSPESQKQSQGELKKQGGLKKFFGRKKDNPNRNSVDVAMLSNSNGLAPPSESNLGRRLSMMRKKPSAKATPYASQPAVAQTTPEIVQEPTMPDSHSQFEDPMASVSQLNTPSDANPEEEFSRFDQGPVDMPATLPTDDADDYDRLHAPAPQRLYNTQLASRIAPERRETEHENVGGFVTPMERPGDLADDAQSEASMDDHQSPEIDPSQDRWAKIRENAAKRAARASEDQSTKSRPSQSVRETDDGETSGEETIESRVARIKARVAELTGNIDGANGTARR